MGDYWASHGQLFRISKVLLSPTQSRFRISKQLCDGRRTQLAIQKGLICANFKDPSLEILGSLIFHLAGAFLFAVHVYRSNRLIEEGQGVGMKSPRRSCSTSLCRVDIREILQETMLLALFFQVLLVDFPQDHDSEIGPSG